MRAVIEGYVAAVATQNITEDTLRALEANLVEFETATAEGGAAGRQRAAALNNDFHKMLLEATGNSSLMHLLTGVLGLPLVHRTFLRYTERDLARSAEHHRELIEALRRRDAISAEMIMKVHIRAAQQAVLEQQERDVPADG
nr:FCD domain-containing protein [Streptomyces sp. SID10853]